MGLKANAVVPCRMDFVVTVSYEPYIGPLQSFEATWILNLLTILVVVFGILLIILACKLHKRNRQRDFFISRYYDAKFGLPDTTREDAICWGYDLVKILDSWEASFERMRLLSKNREKRNKFLE